MTYIGSIIAALAYETLFIMADKTKAVITLPPPGEARFYSVRTESNSESSTVVNLTLLIRSFSSVGNSV